MIYLALLFLLFAPNAWAATYYASPAGSGSTCSQASPCSAKTLIETKVQAGDTGILTNGTHVVTGSSGHAILTQRDGTAANRITIKAENPHQAIIFGTNSERVLTIRHDYYTIQDLILDDNKTQTAGGAIIHIWSNGAPTVGVIIEGNILRNAGSNGIKVWGASDCIIRWNRIDSTGWVAEGEPFYLGSNGGVPLDNNSIDDCEIYANSTDDSIDNFIDFKSNSTNVNIHHNLFENQVAALARMGSQRNQRCIAGSGSLTTAGNRLDDNIFRDCALEFSGGNEIVTVNSHRVDMDDNVWYDINPDSGRAFDGAFGTSTISNNTFCNTASGTSTATSVTFTSNLFNQAQGVCNTEVTRIITEMQSQAGNPQNRWTGPTVASCQTISNVKIQCTWTNNNFPPLANADNTKVTVTEDGGGKVESSTTIVGTNITETTVTAAMSGSATLLISFAASAVTDSACILGSDICLDVPNAVSSNNAVTNNIGGAPATYELEVVDVRFESIDGAETAGTVLTATSDILNCVRGCTFKVRTWLRCNDDDCPSIGLVPYYDLDDAGTYATAVPDTATGDDIRFAGTTNTHSGTPNQGTSTTQRISSGTFVAGLVVRTANAIPTLTLAQDEVSELLHIYTIEAAATPATKICFRLKDQADTITLTHTATACALVKDYTAGSGF